MVSNNGESGEKFQPVQSFKRLNRYHFVQLSIHTLHSSDLGLQTVAEVATSSYKRFRSRLANHPNPLILVLNSVNIPEIPPRRLRGAGVAIHLAKLM